MKYSTILFAFLIPVLLSGCTQKHNGGQNKTGVIFSQQQIGTGTATPSGLPSEQQLLTGNIISGVTVSGGGYTATIAGHTLMYSGLFSIDIPQNLRIRTNEYQSFQIARLDFAKDASPDSRSEGYFKIFVENIPTWKQGGDDTYKCTFGEYDESVTSKNTITKNLNGKTLYITYANFSAMNKTWKQGDLCFIDDTIIYTISVGQYDTTYIQSILDSFHLNDQ